MNSRVYVFDNDRYTTRLDPSTFTAERLAYAERRASEIEASDAGGNFHLAEERGQAIDSGLDEEDRFSAVLGRRSSLSPGIEVMGSVFAIDRW